MSIGQTMGIWSVATSVGTSAAVYVNSVQQVSFAMAGVNSANATIAAVSAARSFVVFQGVRTNNNGSDGVTIFSRVSLLNSTTVVCNRTSADAASTIVRATVVEATNNLVTSVQQGTISLSGVSAAGAISQVNLSRSFVGFLGTSNTLPNATPNTTMVKINLLSSAAVKARVNTSSVHTVGYVVVELNNAIVSQIQHIDASGAAFTATTFSRVVTSVSTPNTMMVTNGFYNNATTVSAGYFYYNLQSTVTAQAVRGGVTSITPFWGFSLVSFVSGVVKSMQRGTITVQSTASNSATITSVDTNKTLANYLGFNANSGSGSGINGAPLWPTLELSGATAVKATVGSASAEIKVISYEAIEFN
jgi:hypothetical protein